MFLLVFVADRIPTPDPGDDDEAKTGLRELYGDAGWECPRILDAMEGAESVYFDRVSQIRMPTWSQGRVLLLGDAASAVSLLAGEGTGLAMAEAYVLAAELHRANGRPPPGLSPP